MKKVKGYKLRSQVYFSIAILLMGTSCSEKTRRVIINRHTMENIIMEYDTAEIVPNKKIHNGDIVVVESHELFNSQPAISAYRVVGIPGDNIFIDSNKVFVNGKIAIPPDSSLGLYDIAFQTGTMPRSIYASSLVNNDTFARSPLTYGDFMRLVDERKVVSIHESIIPRYVDGKQLDTISYFLNHYQSFMDPIRIPRIGESLDVNFFLPVIGLNKNLENKNYIKYNYYFLMGNNDNATQDSREFGLVPEDSIMGVVKHIHHTHHHAMRIHSTEIELK